MDVNKYKNHPGFIAFKAGKTNTVMEKQIDAEKESKNESAEKSVKTEDN